MLSLEDVHWRLSALPAEVAGFRGRGVLKKGAPADIVVYDFDGLKVMPDEIVHDLPGGEWRRVQRAQGYKYVLVNGEVTIRERPADQQPFRPAAAARQCLSAFKSFLPIEYDGEATPSDKEKRAASGRPFVSAEFYCFGQGWTFISGPRSYGGGTWASEVT